MITQIRDPESDDSDRSDVRGMTREADRSPRLDDGGPAPDPYATAELLRRHERTESMIRKAHEQFL